jgi:peptidoglycan/LPS O-acetylase OafA/YrhL
MVAREHRGDIDGLRAIAVLAILLFHLNPTKLTGGFIGVDIFFVISGFLITSNIYRDLQGEGFSFLDFYTRRIRRLYPALVVTVLVTLAAAFFLLFPSELEKTARGAIATVFYVSNIFFYEKINYFTVGEIRPLLHTWSLAVEEQYYLTFPLLLVLLHRFARRAILPALFLIAACSLGLAEYLTRVDASAAFYWSPPRFWEFMAGSLVVFLPHRPLRRPIAEGAALFGLAAILVAILAFTPTSPVPGLLALLPVCGAALVIYVGQQRGLAAAALLSLPPMRFVGRISYSLYLVHWPLIVLTEATYQAGLVLPTQIWLLCASILLAWLSYRYIELPVRRLPLPAYRPKMLAFCAASTLAILITGAALHWTSGFRGRFPERSRHLIAYLDYKTAHQFRSGICLINAGAERLDERFNEARCLRRTNLDRPHVLLIGDSHAAQYYQALRHAFPRVDIAQITATGCRPVLKATGDDRCVDLMHAAFTRIIPEQRFSAIVLAGRWRRRDVPGLVKTARFLETETGTVYVFGPIVEYSRPLPRLLALSVIRDDHMKVVREASRLSDKRALDGLMAKALDAAGGRIHYVSVLRELCGTRRCRTTTASDVPTQFDYGHLTYEGATYILSKLKSDGSLVFFSNPQKSKAG